MVNYCGPKDLFIDQCCYLYLQSNDFECNLEYIQVTFLKTKKFHKPILWQVQFVVFKNIMRAQLFQIAREKSLDYLSIIYMQQYYQQYTFIRTHFQLCALNFNFLRCFGLFDVFQPISMLNILHVYYLEVNLLLCGLIRGNIIIYKCFNLLFNLQFANLFHRGIIAWCLPDINNLTLCDTHELCIYKRADYTLTRKKQSPLQKPLQLVWKQLLVKFSWPHGTLWFTKIQICLCG